MSLKDGTMAWHLAGFDVVHGATRRPPEVSETGRRVATEAASRVAARCEVSRIDKAMLAKWRAESGRRSLYVLDVRTPEEYEAGHLSGARSAPGGQLVQETDSFVATLGARIVLVDDNGVRATMTASWLKQMGWAEVAVLAAGSADGDLVDAPHRPRVLGLDQISVSTIEPAALRDRLAAAMPRAISRAPGSRSARASPRPWRSSRRPRPSC
jgi:rhodanese-related sulfurtransferase